MKLHELRKIVDGIKPPISADDHRKMQERLWALGMGSGNFYQELEMTSRFVDTHQDVSFSNTQVSLHSHAFYEILYCRSDCGVEYLTGSDRYRLQKGDIIMVDPGVSHRPILPEKMHEPYRRDVLWISTEFVNELLKVFPDSTLSQRNHTRPIRTAGTKWEHIGRLFRNGVKEAEEKAPGWEAAVVGNTLLILAHLKRANIERNAGVLNTEKRELLDDITAYIEEHYAEHLTLADFAKRFYVSESTISHLFKQRMGVSLYRYVTQRRLIAAKNLILSGMDLETVAENVGFSDYSSFYRAFKAEFGIPPRDFKKLTEQRSAAPLQNTVQQIENERFAK